jgi:alkylated DNA repair protein alkB family protein 6
LPSLVLASYLFRSLPQTQPHEDGGAYFEAVATVSLASHTLLDIYRYASNPDKVGADHKEGGRPREQEPRFSILQEPRSLLVTRGAAYRAFLHGIAERTEDDASKLRAVVNQDKASQIPMKEALEGSQSEIGAGLKRETRISLTFRDVEKVAPKAFLKMLGKR